ncbi:MAG: sensor histidine kinase, partial [Casimicrobiaceae bacterium]
DSAAFFDLVAATELPHLEATLEASAAQLANWSWSGRLQPRHESTEKWISIRARPRQADEGGVLWDGVVFDDTQSRLAQVELERSREELRELSRHLQTVREEEKQRIAREVHDELGATLSVLKMDLESLDGQLPADLTAARASRVAMIQLVDAAVATTRKIVTDLRPSILDDLGLAAALRWQTGEYQKHTKSRLHFEMADPDLTIDRERGLALFRIFQETITNVARHANAANVWITLAQTDLAYVLTVRDDGAGIREDDLRKPTSHGIRGMRERAQHFGGNMSVSSMGDGTTVIVTIPKRNP